MSASGRGARQLWAERIGDERQPACADVVNLLNEARERGGHGVDGVWRKRLGGDAAGDHGDGSQTFQGR